MGSVWSKTINDEELKSDPETLRWVRQNKAAILDLVACADRAEESSEPTPDLSGPIM